MMNEKISYTKHHTLNINGIWVRKTSGNYYKLFFLCMATLGEFKHRYGKIHGAARVIFLKDAMNIPRASNRIIPDM